MKKKHFYLVTEKLFPYFGSSEESLPATERERESHPDGKDLKSTLTALMAPKIGRTASCDTQGMTYGTCGEKSKFAIFRL